MKEITTVSLTALATMLVTTAAIAAGVPATLTHHGYLTDDHGAAINRDVPMTFKLFDDPSAGTELWSEDIAKVPVADGFYAVTLGLKTPLEPVAAAHADLYLQILVDGQMMLPRQRIGAVPFSFVSDDAVGDIHPASVSIGTKKVIDSSGKWVGDPVAGQGVQSVTATAPLTGGPITSTGAIGIQKASATQDGYLSQGDWAAFNTKQFAVKNACDPGSFAVALQSDGTLVCQAAAGTGTVTEVRTGTGLIGGPITQSGDLSLNTTYTDGRYVNRAGDTLNGQYNILLGGGNGGLSVGLDQLVCAANGNVGVGRSSPQSKLDVNGDIKTGGVQFGNGSVLVNDNNGAIELGNSLLSGTTPYIDFHYGAGAAQDYNVRVVNDADGQLTVNAATLNVTGKIKSTGGQQVYDCPSYSEGCYSGCIGQLSKVATCSYWVDWGSGCYDYGFTQPCTAIGRLLPP